MGRGSRRTEPLSKEKPRTSRLIVGQAEKRADLSDVASLFLKHYFQRAQRSRSRVRALDPRLGALNYLTTLIAG